MRYILFVVIPFPPIFTFAPRGRATHSATTFVYCCYFLLSLGILVCAFLTVPRRVSRAEGRGAAIKHTKCQRLGRARLTKILQGKTMTFIPKRKKYFSSVTHTIYFLTSLFLSLKTLDLLLLPFFHQDDRSSRRPLFGIQHNYAHGKPKVRWFAEKTSLQIQREVEKRKPAWKGRCAWYAHFLLLLWISRASEMENVVSYCFVVKKYMHSDNVRTHLHHLLPKIHKKQNRKEYVTNRNCCFAALLLCRFLRSEKEKWSFFWFFLTVRLLLLCTFLL